MSNRSYDLVESIRITDDWRDWAECKGMDPDLFFPERGDNRAIKEAKKVCASCIVREECLQYAIDAGEDSGIWGGLTVTDFKYIRRLRLRRQFPPFSKTTG